MMLIEYDQGKVASFVNSLAHVTLLLMEVTLVTFEFCATGRFDRQ